MSGGETPMVSRTQEFLKFPKKMMARPSEPKLNSAQ
jgi:hypothetical protein